MLKNKKGFSEITSFVLLFAIIAVASTLAYTFSQNVINEKTSEIDLGNANNYLKKINIHLTEIKNFEENTFSITLSFNKGQYNFVNNTIYYQSLIKYTGSDYCIDLLCHKNQEGYEQVITTIDTPYVFNNNFSLIPGQYLLTFINLKNETKFNVKIN